MSDSASGTSAGSRPVIGISSYSEQASWSSWNMPAVLLPQRYVDRVAEAGGIAVLLPPQGAVGEALSRLDGLLLSGGGDIDPARYEAERAPATTRVSERRDAAEFELFGQALSLGLPVLGICRGMQVINVARGGTLHQHLPDVTGHDGHSPTPGSFATHPVTLAPGGRLAGIIGRPDADVPTHHHQGVDRLGKGLSAAAWAADGLVEAFELDPGEHPFVLAVQWHPEVGEDRSLFRALVAAAAGRPGPATRLATHDGHDNGAAAGR